MNPFDKLRTGLRWFINRPPLSVVSSNKFTAEIAETAEDR
jgi:hypothetical protein